MRWVALGCVLFGALLLPAACAPAAPGLPAQERSAPSTAGSCPTTPIAAVAVENFYGDLLRQLGGQCVQVTSILADPNADPHDYQPSVNDARAYQTARFVVENGLGYDDFSDKILATLAEKPRVLNVGAMLGLSVGDNPHVWYNPDYVERIARAMTEGLKGVAPSAAGYFDEQAATFLGPGLAAYRSSVERLRTQFKGAPVGSTESIFEYVAQATGLNLISPPAFLDAVAEGNEPSVRDLALFQDQIAQRQIKVLVYNVQASTSLTEQMKTLAVTNGIPIVGVSETMPLDARTFQDWQAGQLQQLAAALAGTRG